MIALLALLLAQDPPKALDDRLAIDLLNGSDLLRKWVDDRRSTTKQLDELALADERAWNRERRPFLLY